MCTVKLRPVREEVSRSQNAGNCRDLGGPLEPALPHIMNLLVIQVSLHFTEITGSD